MPTLVRGGGRNSQGNVKICALFFFPLRSGSWLTLACGAWRFWSGAQTKPPSWIILWWYLINLHLARLLDLKKSSKFFFGLYTFPVCWKRKGLIYRDRILDGHKHICGYVTEFISRIRTPAKYLNIYIFIISVFNSDVFE